MKNAGPHAKTLKSLAKTLMTSSAGAEKPRVDPVTALVAAVLKRNTPDSKADKAIQRLQDEFVDFNELRVATQLELVDLLEDLYKDAGDRIAILLDTLALVFDNRGRLHLDDIAAMNRREQRPALKKVNLDPYVEAYVALASLGIGTVPIDETSHAHLEQEDVLEPDTDSAEAHKFVESNVKADEAWPFFVGLREAALSAKPAKKAAKKSTKKTTKKTTEK